ncbi:MAG: carbamoyltransferase C-terminal domain-containing protein [Elusimicrobiota bacterium]
MTASPVTDACGTKLSTAELLRGVAAKLKGGFLLTLDDEGAILTSNSRHPDLEEAHAWLKDRFAGLSVRTTVKDLPDGKTPRIEDKRRVPTLTVALVEVSPENARSCAGFLTRRLGSKKGVPPAGLKKLLSRLHASTIGAGPVTAGTGPFLLAWRRRENSTGLAPAIFIAAAQERKALSWFASHLGSSPAPVPKDFRILIDGLERGILRRPTAAAQGDDIVVDPLRCEPCDVCAGVCPAGRLKRGGTALPDAAACLSCFDCVEACPKDALRPPYRFTSAMRAEAAADRPGWLSRLRGKAGPAAPAPFPPSYLLPKLDPPKKPRYILGLAIHTMQEHAAALLKDGVLVGAVEEEKLARIRHYGWPEPGARRFGFTLEEAFCRRAIRVLLSKEGLSLDDMDVIAINGLPPRYGMAHASAPPGEPLPVIRCGRLMFIPHHLCHAASAFRASGQKDSWVLTVDGRGERQTAALFRARGGALNQVYELPSLVRRSIGGVYESATRLLGFGAHGQGIVMALSGTGRPGIPFERFLSWQGKKKISINEELSAELETYRRAPHEALKLEHRDLAASLQKSLEETILGILDEFVPSNPAGLCVAGGVALNCRMNQLIREKFLPKQMFVQPAANDAGTALGAALEAHALTSPGGPDFVMGDAYLGPDFTESEISSALDAAGLSYRRPDDLCRDAAKMLSEGKILGWFQGRLEFGPRALGARSLLADPRDPGSKDRLNALKSRHSWRPFGPSILAGRETEWFEDAFDSRFMLFTVPVRAEKKALIAAVLHDDGTTRPQSVHAAQSPLYHRLICEFEKLTAVPMVLNTSFNRKDEPIVCTPSQAAEAFVSLGADALVIGPFIATVAKPRATASADPAILRALPGGRRLSLRVTVDCDLQCPHCTIADIAGLAPRTYVAAIASLENGRRANCDELIVMRGEPASWPRLPEMLAAAREMGYRYIQLQTNARSFTRPQKFLAQIDAAEVLILGHDEATHDGLSGTAGSLREALMGTKVLLDASKDVLVTVPVLRGNIDHLEHIPALLAKLGVRRIQFNFPRPVQLPREVVVGPLVRLADAAEAVGRAARAASALGLNVTTEGLPACLLDESLRSGAESAGQWDRFRADDLNGVHDGMGAQIQSRPTPPACRTCVLRETCPRTWALYLEMFGSSELRTVP